MTIAESLVGLGFGGNVAVSQGAPQPPIPNMTMAAAPSLLDALI